MHMFYNPSFRLLRVSQRHCTTQCSGKNVVICADRLNPDMFTCRFLSRLMHSLPACLPHLTPPLTPTPFLSAPPMPHPPLTLVSSPARLCRLQSAHLLLPHSLPVRNCSLCLQARQLSVAALRSRPSMACPNALTLGLHLRGLQSLVSLLSQRSVSTGVEPRPYPLVHWATPVLLCGQIIHLQSDLMLSMLILVVLLAQSRKLR